MSSLPVSLSAFPSGLRLAAKNIALTRGGRLLATGLDVAVTGGEALLVTGPNGAGKSTFLRALAGLFSPSTGAVSLEGVGTDAEVAVHAHYIGHADALKSSLTAAENLDFWASMLGHWGVGAREALAQFALAHTADLPVAYLSAGQKRRVALARLIVAPRPIWLLDEPATALDAASQSRFAALMRGHLDAGGLIVAATHAPLGLDGARELRLGGEA